MSGANELGRRSPCPTRTVIDRRYVSSIPGDIIEKRISDYKRDGGCVWLRRAACLLNGEVVGERCYESDGSLVVEIPLSDGNKQGIEYHWYESGELQSAEPYFAGKPHGVAKQWARDGTLMGTYTIEHGTGFDLWRDCLEDGLIFVSEVHSLRDGLPHGFEWLAQRRPEIGLDRAALDPGQAARDRKEVERTASSTPRVAQILRRRGTREQEAIPEGRETRSSASAVRQT